MTTFIREWVEPEDPRPPAPEQSRLPGVTLIGRRLRWVALGAVLGCLFGIVVLQVRAPVYESTSHLIVVGPPNEPARGFARTAQALARLATAPGIVSFRLDAVGLSEAADDPRRYITVQAAPDAPLISVTGRGDTPANAQKTAATVTAGLSSVGTLGPFRVDVVTQPSVPDGPRVPTWFLPFSGTGLGAAVTLVLAATLPPRPSSGGRHRRRPGAEESVTTAPEATDPGVG